MPQYGSDVAHPRQVDRLQFLIGALHYGRRANFGEIGTQNFPERMAILMASRLVRHLHDADLRHQLEEQLLQIVRTHVQRVAQGQPAATTQEMASLLLEMARHLAQANPDAVMVTFVDLLNQIVALWPPAIPIYRGVLYRLCEELPIEQAKQLWPMLIRLRAD